MPRQRRRSAAAAPAHLADLPVGGSRLHPVTIVQADQPQRQGGSDDGGPAHEQRQERGYCAPEDPEGELEVRSVPS